MNINTQLPWRKGTLSGAGGCVEATPVTTAQRDQLRTQARPRVDLAFELYAAQLRKRTSFNSAI